MLDQDTARALFELTDLVGVRGALVGDRHQLSAEGPGGELDLADRYASDCRIDLDSVRRFTDPAYAELSLNMCSDTNPDEVFDKLVRRGQVVVHPPRPNATTPWPDSLPRTRRRSPSPTPASRSLTSTA